MAIPTASSQFATPVIFNRSGSGPLAVRFGLSGSLTFTIASVWFDESKMRALINVGTQRPSPPKPKKRAVDIFHATVSEYNHIKAQVKQDQIANLFCLVGDKSYDVFQISVDDDLIKISAKDENGSFHRLIFPFEQAAFDIVVSKKTKENEGWGVKFMGFEPAKTEG